MIGAFRGSITQPGFYFFPGMDPSRPASKSEQEPHVARVKQGPTGVLVIQPNGAEAMSPRQLGTELVTNVVSALLAAFLLTGIRSGYLGRVLLRDTPGRIRVRYRGHSFWQLVRISRRFSDRASGRENFGWILAGLVLSAIVRPTGGTIDMKAPGPA